MSRKGMWKWTLRKGNMEEGDIEDEGRKGSKGKGCRGRGQDEGNVEEVERMKGMARMRAG